MRLNKLFSSEIKKVSMLVAMCSLLFVGFANAATRTVDHWGTPVWDGGVHNPERTQWYDPAEWVWIPFEDMEQIEIDVPNMPGFSELWMGGGGIGNYDLCPPELTFRQCYIWRTRPHFRAGSFNPPRTLRPDMMDSLIRDIRAGRTITYQTPTAVELVNRYKLLMNASLACCRDGMLHHMRRAGASGALKYQFIIDDANFYMIGQRCLVTSDEDLDRRMTNIQTAEVMADVRNTCICRSRDWFSALLAPFVQVYTEVPEFQNANFRFQYSDGLQRTITVNINREVQTVLDILRACP